MSYQYRILKDCPTQAYLLPSVTDITGNAGPATIAGASVTAPALVAGGGNSLVVGGANRVEFSSNLFTGSVRQPFSLEAWFKPVTDGPVSILGHGTDGLFWDGEALSFTTRHGTAGDARVVYYPPEITGSMYAVGVHSETKNQLFVNAILVAEVDLTDEQIATNYSTGTAMNSGAGTGSAMVDSLALYNSPLTSYQIAHHLFAARDVPDYSVGARVRGGTVWDLTEALALTAYRKDFNTDFDWREGRWGSITLQSDILSPEFDQGGLSVRGYWTYGMLLSLPEVGGSKIEWDGDGDFDVEVSTDNENTWTPVVNGREIPGVTEGTVANPLDFVIRVVIPEGLPLDTITKVRSLSIRIYADRNPVGDGRVINLVGGATLANQEYHPLEMHDDMGLNLYDGHAEVSAGESIRTIEMWVKVSSSGTVLGNWGSATRYVNGVAGAVLPVNQWSHVVYVLDAATTAAFNIGTSSSEVQIGMLATYALAVVASDILAIYNSYMGVVGISVTDSSSISVTDLAEDIKLYQLDWTTGAA